MIDSECSCLPRNSSLQIEREKQLMLWFGVYESLQDFCDDKLYVLINGKWKDLDTWIFCERCLKDRGGPGHIHGKVGVMENNDNYSGLKKSIERLILGKPDGFIEISKSIRIYYLEKYSSFWDEIGEKDGFEFATIEVTGCDSTSLDHSEKCCWDSENRSFDVLYSGTARMDGMRMFFIGSDNEGATDNKGYIYCPDIETHIKILQEIRKLELKYCDRMNEDG